MEITWYGGSCFRLRDRNTIALADSYLPDPRFQNLQIKTDLATFSRPGLPLRTIVPNIRKTVFEVTRPGEYEVGGIFVSTFPSGTGVNGTEDAASVLVSLFVLDGTSVCHLGQLEEPLSGELAERLTPLDVLLIPHGGRGKLSKSAASDLVSALEPGVVIPMGYAGEAPEDTEKGISEFLEELGLPGPEPVAVLNVSRSSLPENRTEVMLLESKSKEKKPAASKN